jgi:hypothetical protein
MPIQTTRRLSTNVPFYIHSLPATDRDAIYGILHANNSVSTMSSDKLTRITIMNAAFMTSQSQIIARYPNYITDRNAYNTAHGITITEQ